MLKYCTIMAPTVFGDPRGTIQSFFPDDHIVEYNLLTTLQGNERGYHYHPEFVEYIMVVAGVCNFTEYEVDCENTTVLNVGDSVRIPAYLPHSFKAVTDLRFVSMLTKRWDDCDVSLVTIRNNMT
jgi:quercetin dioxygenase-like cupin family protein